MKTIEEQVTNLDNKIEFFKNIILDLENYKTCILTDIPTNTWESIEKLLQSDIIFIQPRNRDNYEVVFSPPSIISSIYINRDVYHRDDKFGELLDK